MPQIKPISDLRNTSEISELCHKKDEPIFITKNGYGDLVIMSIETYERNLALSDIYRKLSEAETQLENKSSLVNSESVFNDIRSKYTIK